MYLYQYRVRSWRMEEFEGACCIRGYHEYKEIWAAALGEELVCEREPHNVHDRLHMWFIKINYLLQKVFQVFNFRTLLSIWKYFNIENFPVCNYFSKFGFKASWLEYADWPHNNYVMPCLLIAAHIPHEKVHIQTLFSQQHTHTLYNTKRKTQHK